MTLGQRIQNQRKKCGLTQEELAEEICTRYSQCFEKLSREAVSRWENDSATPNPETLVALSEIFNISLDELIKGSDDEKGANVKEEAPVPPGAMSGVQTFAEALNNLNEEGGDSDE